MTKKRKNHPLTDYDFNIRKALRDAMRDSDVVSFYWLCDSTERRTWEERVALSKAGKYPCGGAIVIIKGEQSANNTFQAFVKNGMVTPGKPIVNP
jgi:hypothetical protein